jgi:hypothetical protein
MADSLVAYEYQLCPDDHTLVQVRRKKSKKRGHGFEWKTYMQCASAESAERILFLVRNSVEGVYP